MFTSGSGCHQDVQRGLSLKAALPLLQLFFSKEFLLVYVPFSPSLILLGEGQELKKIKRCPPLSYQKGDYERYGLSALAYSSFAEVDDQVTCVQQENGD